MEKQIKTKGVAFNIADEDQFKMYEFCNNKTNFSGYIKRLIQRDMEGGQSAHPTQKMPLIEYQEQAVEEEKEPVWGSFLLD